MAMCRDITITMLTYGFNVRPLAAGLLMSLRRGATAKGMTKNTDGDRFVVGVIPLTTHKHRQSGWHRPPALIRSIWLKR